VKIYHKIIFIIALLASILANSSTHASSSNEIRRCLETALISFEKNKQIVKDAVTSGPLEELEELKIYNSKDINISPVNVHGGESFSGANNMGIFEAELNGQRVLIKKLDSQMNDNQFSWHLEQGYFEEIEQYIQLSRLGLTPKFRGLVKFGDNRYGIISDLISPSFLLRDTYSVESEVSRHIELVMTSVDNKIKELWKLRLKEIVNVLNENNYTVSDFQVLLTPEGKVYVIDIEGFSNSKKNVTKKNYKALEILLNLIQ